AKTAPPPSARTSSASGPGELLKTAFYDPFERAELGPDWNVTTTAWRIEGGRLCGRGAKNHPAWRNRRLPVNARIEFDAISSSSDGDLKAEVWGDGSSAATAISYT